MKTDYKHSEGFVDDLLVKYLLQETDNEEAIRAEEWLNASDNNKKHFEQLKQIWEQSLALKSDTPSEEEAWSRFKKIVKPEEKTTAKRIPFTTKRWAAAAAVIIIIVAGTWVWLSQSKSNATVILASTNQVLTDTLPDQSIVTLNKHSKLSYSKKFKGEYRSVRLKGEAFFKVIHNAKHPFKVKVNKITITDIGTAFNVNTNKNATQIIVASGEVNVTAYGNSVNLTANEKITISKNNHSLKKEKTHSSLYDYYRTKQFVCDNTPLEKLVEKLNEAYDANIVIANSKLEQLPITTTFHQSQPLDSILSIINQTFVKISLSKKGNEIILK